MKGALTEGQKTDIKKQKAVLNRVKKSRLFCELIYARKFGARLPPSFVISRVDYLESDIDYFLHQFRSAF